jgi:acyl-CoA dehydrogenase
MDDSTFRTDSPRLSELLAEVHAMGRTVIAQAAAAVDAQARFPDEAFVALRQARLLSAYVPTEYGGMGLDIVELARICEVLGGYCGSTAMVFAMHQIQVGCIVHHALASPYFQAFARRISEEQLLLASATTELGIGGDVRTSTCAVEVENGRFNLDKRAPVISYGVEADAILVTCRRAPDAGPNDQSQVLVLRGDRSLEPLSDWDTLGFRGTRSLGFSLSSSGDAAQILPAPYADIHSQTMHPFSHVVWAALWTGLAADAVSHARAVVRRQARKTPGTPPPAALRLAEVDTVLFSMRNNWLATATDYRARLEHAGCGRFPSDFGFAIRVSNLKVTASQLIVDIVGKAMLICGIEGYRNDSPHSLGRHLRDAHGAALMVNNDRILGQTSTMQIVAREG